MSATADLLFVEELMPPTPRVRDPKLAAVLHANQEKEQHDIEAVLQKLLARLPAERRGKVAIDHGGIAETIARHSNDYDLVICGNDGRAGIVGLFGSMSENLVRAFRQPVLLLRVRPDR
jgi:nucleotide-binding universal stress UspA family protein